MSQPTPDLSVVVTVVEGGSALSRCLGALLNQKNEPLLEIIVPYDDSVPEVARLTDSFPSVLFLDLGRLSEDNARQNAFTNHRLYDIRRSRGLEVARGRLLAIVEDRGRPNPEWARAMVDLHEKSQFAAIGGVVENGGTGALRWAIFFCDFGRFQPPIFDNEPEYITDTNICYKRQPLEDIREYWRERYQEPKVNWELRRRGLKLHLSEQPVTIQERGDIRLWSVLKERVHWGRLFGQIRGREVSRAKRLVLGATTPLLPWLLFARHLSRQLRKRRNVREFIYSGPFTALLLVFWAVGEFVGYFEAGRQHEL